MIHRLFSAKGRQQKRIDDGQIVRGDAVGLETGFWKVVRSGPDVVGTFGGAKSWLVLLKHGHKERLLRYVFVGDAFEPEKVDEYRESVDDWPVTQTDVVLKALELIEGGVAPDTVYNLLENLERLTNAIKRARDD
jgi:hypothetical protein